jgi:endonuclease III related protein
MATTRRPADRRTVEIYEILSRHYGPMHWWPADTPFEVCIGAILTQSTSWSNVEKAISNMKGARLMSPKAIASVRKDRLARMIRPSLYYNVKARKLKEFVRFLNCEFAGKVDNMAAVPTDELRGRLLSVWGLGPETVDSILLYAQNRPSFVVDAYTRRICFRLGLTGKEDTYEQLKAHFEARFPKSVRHYNEFHALIVEHGKRFCRAKPICAGCPLACVCAGRI